MRAKGRPFIPLRFKLIEQGLALLPRVSDAPQRVLLQNRLLGSVRMHKCRSCKATTLAHYDRSTVPGLTDTDFLLVCVYLGAMTPPPLTHNMPGIVAERSGYMSPATASSHFLEDASIKMSNSKGI